eukprot:gene3972-4597_t
MTLLYANAKALIRENLNALDQGKTVTGVVIGKFTQDQFTAINAHKELIGLPKLESPEIIFIGSHLYKSRITKDRYTVDDVMKQIESALMDTSIVLPTNMTAIQSITRRQDGYGNNVKDEAVFECTQKKPRAELYSVVPKQDHKKPPKEKPQP